jgi:hypothetical protein
MKKSEKNRGPRSAIFFRADDRSRSQFAHESRKTFRTFHKSTTQYYRMPTVEFQIAS